MARPVALRKHAILKHHYRRAVAATPDFQTLNSPGQWAVLRDQVKADPTSGASGLLDILDSRESRRDEVLAALEEGRVAPPRTR
jgi:hypothetical protein